MPESGPLDAEAWDRAHTLLLGLAAAGASAEPLPAGAAAVVTPEKKKESLLQRASAAVGRA